MLRLSFGLRPPTVQNFRLFEVRTAVDGLMNGCYTGLYSRNLSIVATVTSTGFTGQNKGAHFKNGPLCIWGSIMGLTTSGSTGVVNVFAIHRPLGGSTLHPEGLILHSVGGHDSDGIGHIICRLSVRYSIYFGHAAVQMIGPPVFLFQCRHCSIRRHVYRVPYCVYAIQGFM